MIGALKCCGGGAKVLRNAAPPVVNFPPAYIGMGVLAEGDYKQCWSPCCSNVNWSQRRFLRSFTPGSRVTKKTNAQFTIAEIIRQISKEDNGITNLNDDLLQGSEDVMGVFSPVLASEHENVKAKSIRGYIQYLLDSLPSPHDAAGAAEFVADISRIKVDNGSIAVRVKNKKVADLLKEWISIQPELLIVKRDRLIDYQQRLQVAGEKALKEMEVNLRKSMNLDDLDQAIEGALCSQAKTECNQNQQHKSSYDN